MDRYMSAETWYDASDDPFQPQVHYYVGGATKLYGAALYRLRERGLRRAAPPRRHLAGVADRLRADGALLHAGRAAVPGARRAWRGSDRTADERAYPFPPVSHEPRIQQLADDLAAIGHHPFHAPCGVMLDEANMPYSACVRCGNCDGFPCLVHAKSDAEVIAVRPAIEHENVTLLRNAEAVRLRTNPAGTVVTEVLVDREGQRETFTADIVVVSCGAANSAKLLLASANERHPNGLANGSDQVGRNYMFHNSLAVLALSMEPNPTVFQKTLGLNDFYFSGEDFDFPIGNIQMVGKSQAPMFRGEKPTETKLAPAGRSRTSPSMRSTSGSRPRTSRRPRTGSPSTTTARSCSPTSRPTPSPAPALEQLQIDARPPRDAPSTI